MRFSPLVTGPRPHVEEARMQPRHRLQRNLFEEEHAVPEIAERVDQFVIGVEIVDRR